MRSGIPPVQGNRGGASTAAAYPQNTANPVQGDSRWPGGVNLVGPMAARPSRKNAPAPLIPAT